MKTEAEGARAGGQRKWEMERRKSYGKGMWERKGGRTAEQAAADRETVAEVGVLASAESHPLGNSTFLGESPPSSPGTEGKV